MNNKTTKTFYNRFFSIRSRHPLCGSGLLTVLIISMLTLVTSGLKAQTGEALNFDGTNDHVSLPNSLPAALTAASTTAFTIEYWFKGTSYQSAVRFQTGAGYIVAGWNGLHIISTDGGIAGISVGAGATDGNWHHIAMTWQKNTANGFKSYLDGVLVDQRNSDNVNLPVIASGGYLGAFNGTSEFMNGSLDEVRIWTRALSAAEIAANRFVEITSTGNGLLACYHFNQGIAGGNNAGITSLTDGSGNNYTGTLTNFTLDGAGSNWIAPGFPKLTINSFSPESGPIGTTVTITGNGFNTTPSNNVVYFGAAQATVSSASATSLTVTVPPGANFQNIYVTNLGTNLTTYSSKPFKVTFIAVGTLNFASRVDFFAQVAPLSEAFSDLDKDGRPDLAVATNSNGILSILRNTSSPGSISFAGRIDFNTGSSPSSVSIGDLDGDGKPDVAVANTGSSSISVFRNISTPGSISLAGVVNFTTMSAPYSVSIGDIDGDGKPDLAVSSGGGPSVSVLLNTSTPGTISFATRVDFAAGSTPRSVSIGDIDGDGKPDLVASSSGSNSVGVFRNTSTTGVASFASRIDFGTGNLTYLASIGDIDGDGKPDLSVANFSDNTVSVLRNTSTPGSISFAARVNYASGPNPMGVSLNDLDGDGKTDVASGNSGTNSISVLRNTSTIGNVNLAGNVDYSTSSNTRSLTICDVDGDGRPDLVGGNFNAATVSVLRNITPVPVPATITLAIQGFYNSASNRLDIRDTVRVYLRGISSPFNVVDSAKSVIDSVNFTGSFLFTNAPAGTYYLQVKGRNCLETWSKTGGESFVPGVAMNYNFTTAITQAYGSNMLQIDASPVRYGIYSGDVNKDGTIDVTDLGLIDNDVNNFTTGYVLTDLTGDYTVDISDLTIADNNAFNFVGVIRP